MLGDRPDVGVTVVTGVAGTVVDTGADTTEMVCEIAALVYESSPLWLADTKHVPGD